jgi:hypothetical protein
MSAQEVTKPEPAAEVAAATPASSAPSEAAGTEGDENKPSKKGGEYRLTLRATLTDS